MNPFKAFYTGDMSDFVKAAESAIEEAENEFEREDKEMKNKEFYKEQILKCIMDYNCSIAIDKDTNKLVPCEMLTTCTRCKLDTPFGSCTKTWREWLELEHEEQLLTKKEKTYLENVVKPFKERINYIAKDKGESYRSFICIDVKTYYNENFHDVIYLPLFDGDKMYTGMEYCTKYTLKELGLFNDETAE